MLESLVPPFAACAETRQDLLEVDLFPSERAALGRAVEKRRREFVTGRACARVALERLGVRPVAVPSGPRGEPVWPAGVVGSITHCRGFRACAVARSDDAIAIGIDAEPNEPLPAGVLEEVVHGRELELLRTAVPDETDLPRLLFSAKEAVYKAWFPLTGRWLDFADAELSIDPAASTFHARLRVEGPIVRGVSVTEFTGRWTTSGGIICTAVVVPA